MALYKHRLFSRKFSYNCHIDMGSASTQWPTVSTCKYCWQQVSRCDYEEHIGRSCPDLPMECVFECGKYIARKIMKQHCQQQYNNAERMMLLKDDNSVITCIAVQEADEY